MSGFDFDGLAKDIVGIGMELAGSAKKSAIVHLGKNQAYNAETDSLTGSGGQDITLQGFFYHDKQRQNDSNATTADFLIEGKDLPSKIDEADNLTIDGEDWNIADVDEIQNGAAYILRLRK